MAIQKHKKNISGFTLIETLIYIAIIGGVLITFFSFTLSVSESRNKAYIVQEVQANMRVASEIITRSIHEASGINTSTSVFGTDPGILVLTMTSSALNPTIFSLNQNDGALQIKQGSAPSTTITSDEVKITHLAFTNLTGSSTHEHVRVQMTIDYNTASDDPRSTYTQTATTSASVRQ